MAEIASARTETSDTYRLPNGEREARLYEAPVNEKVSPGKWEPIDESLERAAGSSLVSEAGSLEMQLPNELGTGPARLTIGSGAWVSSRLLGTASEPAEVEGATASYELNGSDASIELSSLTNGIKEDIELPDPSTPSTYRFELRSSASLTPKLADDGSVKLSDGEKIVAVLPAPTMSDSSSQPDAISRSVHYKLEPGSPGTWTLTVEASREWLESPDRVWPVTIDPSIVKAGAYFDCSIFGYAPYETLNYCAANGYPILGAQVWERASGTNEVGRSAYQTPSWGLIPANAEINSATLNLYSPGAAENTEGIQLARIEGGWNNNISWKYSGYPGNCATCGPWVNPGGTGGASQTIIGEETTATRGGSGAGWWTVPVQRAVAQEWSEGNDSGFEVEELREQAHGCSPSCVYRGVQFESSAAANVEHRPYLAVTYTQRAPASSVLISPTQGLRTGRRLKLQAAWSVAGVTGVTYEFREGLTAGEPFKPIPLNLITTGSGEPISKWPMPTSGFQSKPVFFDAAFATEALRSGSKSKIQVRALFEGPSEVNGFGAPVEAKLNRVSGGPKDAVTEIGPGKLDLLTGSLSVSRTDFKLPTPTAGSLEFSRTFSWHESGSGGVGTPTEEEKSVLGPGWKSVLPIVQSIGSEWRNLRMVTQTETIEGRAFPFNYVVVTDLEGGEMGFERTSSGQLKAPPEATGWTLTDEGTRFVLASPTGTTTVFENSGTANEYIPVKMTQPAGEGNAPLYVYELKEGTKRLHAVIGPSAKGYCSTESAAEGNNGCHLIKLSYLPATTWGAPASFGERLASISLQVHGFEGYGTPVKVAEYSYDSAGRLAQEWDPRITPLLKESYSYTSSGRLASLTPAGQEPWLMDYGVSSPEDPLLKLLDVRRASLLSSPTQAQTSVRYGVPLVGSGAPVNLAPAAAAEWGQEDIPLDGTAIFPPSEIPASAPSKFTQATVYYLDAEGHIVNKLSPAGAGTSVPSLSTAEVDEFGNITRELSSANRKQVLAEPVGNRVARSKELDVHRLYSLDGTQMEEEWGPAHTVQLANGSTAQGRFHKVVQFNQGWSGTGVNPHLPTRETTGALVGGELLDQRVTEHAYNWTLRRPIETTIDPGAGEPIAHSVTAYDPNIELTVEERQPSGKAAGTVKTIYYNQYGAKECEARPRWANLPCLEIRADQESATGSETRPELLTKYFRGYNALGEPNEIWEYPGKDSASPRITKLTYDLAGRLIKRSVEGAGSAVPPVESTYSSTQGLPEAQRFVCTAPCNKAETKVTYDTLGRERSYADADGNQATTTYDLDGRPSAVTDAKGTSTFTYDAASGLPIQLAVSGVGTFTASYDADGNQTAETLPNGLKAQTTYNSADEAISRSYLKTGACGGSCTWFSESVKRSVFGQIAVDENSLATESYSYDKMGRVLEARETPAGGGCTVRTYLYDQDSNRTEQVTRPPGIGGQCATTGGSVTKAAYDGGDRLEYPEIAYDSFGRITKLPGALAGGSDLNTVYYPTDAVAVQTQGKVTNSYELDATLRDRARLQGGGLEGTEVFHYDEGSDTPSWTERAGASTRYISGLNGGLTAIAMSTGSVTFDVIDLRGNVVASSEASTEATKLTGSFRYDEFGRTLGASPGRYGWAGSAQRPTELNSGIIQMGAREYSAELGRFLAPDPVKGGSANPYDYANGDPINGSDFMGTCAKKGLCGGYQKVGPPHLGPAPAASPATAAPAAPAASQAAPPVLLMTAGGGRGYVGQPTHIKSLGCTFYGPIGVGTNYPDANFTEIHVDSVFSCQQKTVASGYLYTADRLVVGPIFQTGEVSGGTLHLYISYYGTVEHFYCLLFNNDDGSKKYCGQLFTHPV